MVALIANSWKSSGLDSRNVPAANVKTVIGIKAFAKDELVLSEAFEKRSLFEQMKVVWI
jgi:hypothetical protein